MRGSTASACNSPLPTLIRACRDLRGRSGFALPSSLARAHSCVPLFRKCSLAPPQRPIAPSRPLSPQPRIGATLRRAPLRGRALPPLPAGVLSSIPSRRQPATRPPTPLTFGAQPTAPSIAHCQRPALPTVNTPRLPNLPPPSGAPRHKRRGIRSAASTEVPKPVGTPRRIPNRQRSSRRRSPEHRHAPSQAPSRLNRASGSSALPGRKRSRRPLPNERSQPSLPPPLSSDTCPTRRRRDGRRGRRSWPADAPSA